MITRFVLYLGCNGVDMNLKHLDTCHSFKYIRYLLGDIKQTDYLKIRHSCIISFFISHVGM